VIQLSRFVVRVVLEGAVMFELMVSGKFVAGIAMLSGLVIMVLINVAGVPSQMNHTKHLLLMKHLMHMMMIRHKMHLLR
jgi:hypothetical protein